MFKVAFLYIGGLHQVFHTAAVAAELSKRPDVEVHCLCTSLDIQQLVETICAGFGAPGIKYTQMALNPVWRPILRTLNIGRAHKILRLHAMRHELATFDAIVTPERTSAILKGWLPASTKLIHFRHGVGDGQKGFENRVRAFDLVVVSGEKDRQRLYNDGVVERGKCAVAGSVKLATVGRLQSSRKIYFENSNPVVLYNPHFNEALGSWESWGREIVSQFARQSAFNLILAPHIRMFENSSVAEREAFESLAIPGKILVDSGSLASCDMSYTFAADIFLGDVSSQAYEFISAPRPCVFLNSHNVDWRNDKNYAFWNFGDVADSVDSVFPALTQAHANHLAHYKHNQMSAIARSLGDESELAPSRAASAVMNCIHQRSPELQESAIRYSMAEPVSVGSRRAKEDAA